MVKEYVLNETTLRTSNNFDINDLNIKLDIPEKPEFENLDIFSEDIDKLEIKVDNKSIEEFKSKIGLSFNNKYKVSIQVKENVVVEKPVYISYKFNNDHIFVNEIEINCKKNSSCNFIIKYSSNDNLVVGSNYLKQITKVNENANIKISILNLINEKSNSLIAVENSIEDNANLDYNFIDLGGKNKISNYYCRLNR